MLLKLRLIITLFPRSGTSFTLFTEEDQRSVDELIEVLEEAGQHVPSELLDISRLKSIGKQMRSKNKSRSNSYGGRHNHRPKV